MAEDDQQIVCRILGEMVQRIENLGRAGGSDDAAAVLAPIEIPLVLESCHGVLRFAPSPNKPGKWILELSIASESGLSTSSQWLDTGDSDHLIEYLRRPEVVADTLATAHELALSLSRHRLA